jgi:hypothetical protein
MVNKKSNQVLNDEASYHVFHFLVREQNPLLSLHYMPCVSRSNFPVRKVDFTINCLFYYFRNCNQY